MTEDDDLLGTLPADGELHEEAMAARLRSKLFGDDQEGVRVGRFELVRPLGEGGMGAVYAARDPELDREVAIKLLRSLQGTHIAGAAARLRREAKVLARLNHPNVVGIHEVGEHEGHVFVAMELVPGSTLGQWALQHPPGSAARTVEALRLLVQAGRGLAAAHEVGLVHRDVKPANILVGDDGRVRVADFGLARGQADGDEDALVTVDMPVGSVRASLTSTGRVVGTPAYMAPEQFDGAEVGTLADQYAFCVTAWEVLFGQRPFHAENVYALRTKILEQALEIPDAPPPVPSAVRNALRRGLAHEPTERFDSMGKLLGVLAEYADPTRGRRRRLVAAAIGVGAVAIVVAYVAGEVDRECDPQAALTGTWDAEHREAVHAAFAATELPFAEQTWSAAAKRLDRNVERWMSVYRTGCADERQAACLQQRKRELRALVDVLRSADRSVVGHALQSVASLPDPLRCADAAGRTPPPADAALVAQIDEVREELARAWTLKTTGKPGDALEQARAAADRATALGWAPLQLEARLGVASTLEGVGHYQEARDEARAAFLAAQEVADDEAAIDAALLLAAFEGTSLGRPGDGMRWLEQAQALLARSEERDPEVELRALSLLGELRAAQADFGGAHEAYERVIELRGDDDPLAYRARANLGRLQAQQGKDAEARETLQRALAACYAGLGERTPACLSVELALGEVEMALGEGDAAARRYQALLASYVEILGPDHPDTALLLRSIGDNERARGHPKDALVALQRAYEIFAARLGEQHPGAATILQTMGVVHFMQGNYAEALPLLENALAVLEASHGPRAVAVGGVHANVGIAYGGLHRFDEAKAHYEAALSITRENFGPDHVRVGTILSNLGLLALELQKYHEAFDYQSRALTIEIAAHGETHPTVANIYTNLGVAEAGRGRHEEAIEYYEKAREIVVARYGDSHPIVGQIVGNIGWAHVSLGQTAEAVDDFERALAIYAATERSPVEAAPLRFELAKALWTLGGNQKRAREEALRAKAEYETVPPSDYAQVAEDAVATIDAWLDAH